MNVVLRADSSRDIGTGHVTRSLALGRALVHAGHRPVMLSAAMAPAMIERVAEAGIEHRPLEAEPGSRSDAAASIVIAERLRARWLVMDGYHFEADYRTAIRGTSARRLVIDDWGGVDDVDLVLNQNPYADEELYPLQPAQRRLLGPRYALLQQEFLGARKIPVRQRSARTRVLVSMGGADPGNVTLAAVRALAALELPLDVRVIVGSAHPSPARVAAVATAAGYMTFRDRSSLVEDISWCESVVGAFGTSALEYACLGRPLAGVIVADNQQRLARSLEALGVAVVIGEVTVADDRSLVAELGRFFAGRSKWKQMAALGRALVDGRGAPRVVGAMEAMELVVRPAVMDDSELVWRWANDPATRSASFSSDPIPWSTHVEWFRSRLADPDVLFTIGEVDQVPMGVVRVDLSGTIGTVSINLSPQFRGRGLAAPLLNRVSAIARDRGILQLDALAKPTNTASIAAFQSAGFAIQAGDATNRAAAKLVKQLNPA